jgi:hypothetical protein
MVLMLLRNGAQEQGMSTALFEQEMHDSIGEEETVQLLRPLGRAIEDWCDALEVGNWKCAVVPEAAFGQFKFLQKFFRH